MLVPSSGWGTAWVPGGSDSSFLILKGPETRKDPGAPAPRRGPGTGASAHREGAVRLQRHVRMPEPVAHRVGADHDQSLSDRQPVPADGRAVRGGLEPDAG